MPQGETGFPLTSHASEDLSYVPLIESRWIFIGDGFEDHRRTLTRIHESIEREEAI
jgi:hypothetical protein